MENDLEKLWAVVKTVMEAVELAEKGVKSATQALSKGKADLSQALEDLDMMRAKLAAGDAKADAELEAKFDKGQL